MAPRVGGDGESALSRRRGDKDEILLDIVARCRRLRIRVLAGGGPVLLLQGRIAPGVSRSVAIIVDPASIRHLYDELFGLGWRMAARHHRFALLPLERVVLVHPERESAVSMFAVVPGFFADPETTFDLLWERRRDLAVRGMTVPSLDRVATAILAAHDGLDGRHSSGSSNFGFWVDQFRRALTDAERVDLGQLVQRVGGVEEMRPLLVALAIEPGGYTLPSIAYTRWRLRIDEPDEQVRRLLAWFELPAGRRRELFHVSTPGAGTARHFFSSTATLPRSLWLVLTARRRWRAEWADS